ncbi:hypothetical protein CAEBREN_14948 [Caenorhabditis brenneri]|uniref:Uncharacterized protein n=1 Tax=Caenorhabditis brenneri TaxID=135651 RepID=G0NUY0_CAEBE|nr:hypothetical protein CAEBREN_14948 [Caenorhabditis brenneri]
MISIAGVILLERVFETIKNMKDQKFIRENPKPEEEDALKEWEERKKENQPTFVMVLLFFIRIAVFSGYVFLLTFIFEYFESEDLFNEEVLIPEQLSEVYLYSQFLRNGTNAMSLFSGHHSFTASYPFRFISWFSYSLDVSVVYLL